MVEQASEDDTVEGLQGTEGAEDTEGLEEYPLDSLLIRSEPRSIQDVLRRIEKGFVKLDPEFQRDFVWTPEQQSRLIESVVMRIPLPVFYLAENEDGKLVVVDGLQRLTTFQKFSKNELKLQLKRHPELHEKRFSEMPMKFQNRFEDGPLQLYLLDSKAPERVRLDIFDRVNSGTPLTRQQMRNALYSGPATKLLRELAATDEFRHVAGPLATKKKYINEQRDREVINRFLSFQLLGWRAYGETGKSDLDEFLAAGLRRANKMDDAGREQVRDAFLSGLKLNQRVFGRHAFCKHETTADRKHPFNVALFEVFCVLLATYVLAAVNDDACKKLQKGFYGLMKNAKFVRSISAATTAVDSVRARFELAEEMVRRALNVA